MKGTVNFLGDTTAPYLKSFSVNGLKHKVINCTYGGERGKTSIKSLSYLSLNKFILSANCSDAWRKREREASSWKYVTDQGLTVASSLVSPNLRSLNLYKLYRPLKSVGHSSDNGQTSKTLLVLSAPTYLIELSFVYFFSSQNELVWELETWFIAFVPDRHTWEMYTSSSQGSKCRWLRSPKTTYPRMVFTSLLYYKRIISWKLLHVQDFGSKLTEDLSIRTGYLSLTYECELCLVFPPSRKIFKNKMNLNYIEIFLAWFFSFAQIKDSLEYILSVSTWLRVCWPTFLHMESSGWTCLNTFKY